MRRSLLRLALSVGLVAALPAQTASYMLFGPPNCDPIFPQGVPRLGSTFTVSTLGTWINISRFLFTGVSDMNWGGVMLPLSLPGMCGTLNVSGELILSIPTCMGGFFLRGITFSIPNDPALLGARFYQQGVAIFHGQLRTTQAGRGTIGT